MKDYYEILGVGRNATNQEIKQAYRRLMQMYHPDKNSGPGSNEMAIRINEAYSVLIRPLMRREYDEKLTGTHSERVNTEETPRSEDDVYASSREEEVHHYCCSKCGRQDASLRVSVFISVLSLIFVTHREKTPMLLCDSCRLKQSIVFNLKTILGGWWGFPWGPIYTIYALFVNGAGGEQPDEHNDILLSVLSYDFYRQGRYNEAIECIRKSIYIKPSDKKMEFLKYLSTMSSGIISPKRSPSLHPAFANIILVGLVAGLLALAISASSSSSGKYTANVPPAYTETQPLEPSAPAAANPADIQPAHYTQEPSALRTSQVPDITTTGYLKNFAQKRKGGLSTFTVDNSQNSDGVMVKIFYTGGDRPRAVRAFTIMGGDKFTAKGLLPGMYEVRYKDSSGQKFKTQPINLVQREEYDGTSYSNVSITLYKVINGNMHTYPISEEEFEM